VTSSFVLVLAVVAAQPEPEPPAKAAAVLLRQQIILQGGIAGGVALPAPAPALAALDDESLLRSVDLPTDPESLTGFLRRQKVDESQQQRILALIKDLGHDDFETRQGATDELIRVGPTAGPELQRALKASDLEIVRRAEICLRAIDSVAGPAYQEAVVRLLAKKAPQRAVEILLDVVPDLRGPNIIDVVAEALGKAGVQAGRPAPELVLALRDKATARREVAGEAIARAGDADARKVVLALLNDPDPLVRLRVATTLLDRGESAAMPVLIDLLDDVPLDRAYEAEGALLVVAREQAPAVGVGKTPESRKAAVAAWQDWLKATGEKLDLAKVMQEANKPGALVLSMQGPVAAGGIKSKVCEIDAAGKVAWELETNGYAYSAQKLPRDRVLVTEYTNRKISEVTTKGDVVWSKDNVNMPIEAVRLQDGNTLIGTRNQIIEVDGEGKEVRTINRTDLMYAMTALPRGEIGVVTSAAKFVRLDREGKELGSFALAGRMYSIGGHFAMSPNGSRVTVPIYGGAVVVGGAVVQQTGKVVEYDATGKVIWEADADRPTSVRRLANGNVLVASRFHGTILELDSRGKLVNKYEAPNASRVLDARR